MADNQAGTPAHENQQDCGYTDAEAEASKEAWLEQMADQLAADDGIAAAQTALTVAAGDAELIATLLAPHLRKQYPCGDQDWLDTAQLLLADNGYSTQQWLQHRNTVAKLWQDHHQQQQQYADDLYRAGLHNTPTDTQPNLRSTDYSPLMAIARSLTPPTAPPATLLDRDDGAPLIYAHRTSFVVGNPGEGKTWVAAIAAATHLQAGGRVLWIDNEDTGAALGERLRTLTPQHTYTDGRLLFVDAELFAPDGKYTAAQLAAIAWLHQDATPALVVLDSANSFGCPSDGADIADWWAQCVAVWHPPQVPEDQRCAVLVVDHRPKAKDGVPGP